jgi:hypothetical protein
MLEGSGASNGATSRPVVCAIPILHFHHCFIRAAKWLSAHFGSEVTEPIRLPVPSIRILFQRPRGEDPFDTGRDFYHAWLDIERASFCACPITVG